MDKALGPALKLYHTRASLVSNVDSRANETYTRRGAPVVRPEPLSLAHALGSDGLSVGAGSRAPAGACSGQDAAPTKWVTLPDWKVIPLPPGQPGERVCSPSELRQLLGLPLHNYVEDSAYKERIATSPAAAEDCCSKWAVIGQCAEGHTIAKEILCGREWCVVCGEEWSKAHQRRFARWLPKAQQIARMGYWVIELPDASRYKLRTKRELSDMGKLVKACFVELGYKRGLRRWHYFGDQRQGKYNPHLNILVDGAYIEPELLAYIKEYLRFRLGEPSLIVNYSYLNTVRRMVHKVKYVTRATFSVRSWDDELANELFNFQNSNYWGTWRQDIAWTLDQAGEDLDSAGFEYVKAIQAGLCPICGKPLKWSRSNGARVQSLALAKFGIDGSMLQQFGRGFLGDDTRERISEAMHRSSISERISFVRSLRSHTTTEANLLSMDMVRQCGAREIGGGYWIFPVLAGEITPSWPEAKQGDINGQPGPVKDTESNHGASVLRGGEK